jgi:hypothetical protein
MAAFHVRREKGAFQRVQAPPGYLTRCIQPHSRIDAAICDICASS